MNLSLKICSLWMFVVESWVSEFSTSMVLFLNWHAILTTEYDRWLLQNYFSQPPAPLHFLTTQTGCQEVTEMQVWAERGLGTPWLIGAEWYSDSSFYYCLQGLSTQNRVMSAISIRMSQLDSPLLVKVCFLTFEIHPCLNVSLSLAFEGFVWVLHLLHFLGIWWKSMQVPKWFDSRLLFFCLK